MTKIVKIEPVVKPNKLPKHKDPEYLEELKKDIIQKHNQKLKK